MSDELPSPMLAVAAKKLPADDDAWAYEMKWDGYRAIVEVSDDQLRIVSRRGNDVTARYPELDGLPEAVGIDIVLDGELVVLDDGGRPSFQAIQNHTSAAVLMFFDVLRVDGEDTMGMAWHARRALLDRLGLAGERWQTPPAVVGAGARTEAAARGLGLEGVVAKRVDSPYLPGKRSSAWRKVRFMRRQEMVVGGWLPGEGRLSGTVGSLLVGVHDGAGGPLRYSGRVGSGLDDRGRDALAKNLVARDTSPFDPPVKVRNAVWVEPDVVAEVAFSEWTDDGVLRQPVFVALCEDKDPVEVVREP
jgi:bifunctional non-homologous end joining protein LigD